MESVLAVVVGVLFAAGVYLMLRPNVLKLVLGLVLLGSGVNLLIFVGGRLVRGHPPLIRPGEVEPAEPFANPLPQAMILTAIVISFGLVAFTLVLVYRAYQVTGTMSGDAMEEGKGRGKGGRGKGIGKEGEGRGKVGEVLGGGGEGGGGGGGGKGGGG